MTTMIPKALTIGGSDSSGSAGIQADIKTFAALGVHGASVLTAVAAQNTREIAAVAEVPEEVVIAQIDTVLEDIGADAIKTGMLTARSIVECVVDRLEAWGASKLVVDPVMVSRGVPLLKPDALATLRHELLPLALVTTPTVAEAEALSGRRIGSLDDAREAARAIHALGPSFVVIMGGPSSALPVDLLFHGDDCAALPGGPLVTGAVHGARDVFAAAIAALLAGSAEPLDAIDRARAFVEQAAASAVAHGDGLVILDPISSPAASASIGRTPR